MCSLSREINYALDIKFQHFVKCIKFGSLLFRNKNNNYTVYMIYILSQNCIKVYTLMN